MTTSHACPNCGANVPSGPADGLCPKCLLQVGLGDTSSHNYTITDPQISVSVDGNDLLPPTKLASGSLFGKYRIHSLLGKGGMGEVYEAEDTESGRRLALKVLSHKINSPEAYNRFIREGRTAAYVNHPNSVYIFGTEKIDTRPVISMEYVPGGTLKDLVTKDGPVTPEKAVDIIMQIISGLDAAWEKGILHRDIKPANCFIEPSGTVKIGDYGLSISTLAVLDTQDSAAGTFRGTPAFASPEQLRGESLDFRSDMYSVGVTLFYLLTGDLPFKESHFVRLMAKVLEEKPPYASTINANVPWELAQIIHKCLAKTPEQRYGSYQELLDALLPFVAKSESPAHPLRRAVAYTIDLLIAYTAIFIISYFLFSDLSSTLISPNLNNYFFNVFICIAYLSFFEGRFAYTPGKRLLHLHVTQVNSNQTCSPLQGVSRALLWSIPPIAPTFLALFFNPETPINQLPPGYGWASTIIFLTFFVSMRRKNGFASLYDLLTKTRVTEISSSTQMRSPEKIQPLELPKALNINKIGPYIQIGKLTHSDDKNSISLIHGFDTQLFRSVWIRLYSNTTQSIDPNIQNISRYSRLRWLGGQRLGTANGSWDAYEAPNGSAFLTQIQTPMSWDKLRHLLHDLVNEMAISESDQSLPDDISLNNLWVTGEGRLKLLNFSAPGVNSKEFPSISLRDNPCQGTKEFIVQMSKSALHADLTANNDNYGAPAIPLPLHAHRFYEQLTEVSQLSELRTITKTLLTQDVNVSGSKKFSATLIHSSILFITAFFALVAIAAISFIHAKIPETLPYYHAAKTAELLDSNGFYTRSTRPIYDMDSEVPLKERAIKARDAFAVYAASLKQSMDKRKIDNEINDFLTWFTENILPEDSNAVTIVEKHKNFTAPELEGAIAYIDSTKAWRPKVTESIIEFAIDYKDIKWPVMFAILVLYIFFSWALLFYAAIPTLISNLFFRSNYGMSIVGINLVDNKGRLAGRFRRCIRTLLLWTPTFLLTLPFILAIQRFVSDPLAQGSQLYGTYALLAGALLISLGMFLDVILSKRSLIDRLMGLWIVPR